MLNQTAVTSTSAFGFGSRMFFWTQLAPALQIGQVGDNSRINRTDDLLITNPNQGVEPTWTYGPKCRLSWGFVTQRF